MDIRPLLTEADYDWALAEIEPYFQREPAQETPEAARFDPVEAIRCRMREKGYHQADLARLLGSRSRASEILARRRAITMEQAYKLHREWLIPAEILIRPYHPTAS